jgi:GAF domain-containing protein
MPKGYHCLAIYARLSGSILDPNELIPEVYRQTKKVIDADIFTFSILDPAKSTLDIYAVDKGTEVREKDSRLEGLTKWVIENAQPLFVRDAETELLPVVPVVIESGIPDRPLSFIFVPLVVGGRTLGVISVQSYRVNVFTESHLRILSAIANQAAIAIENARRFQDIQRKTHTLEHLREVSQAVTRSITDQPKEVLEQIVKGACELIGADCAVIYPYDFFRKRFYDIKNVAAYGIKQPLQPADKPRSDTGMTAFVVRESLLVREDIAGEDPEMLQSPFIGRERIKAFVGLSLRIDRDVAGVLFVNFRAPHHFASDELTTVQLLGEHAAIAIENSRLYAQTSDRLAERVTELEVIRDIDRRIAAALDLDVVLNLILDHALTLTTAEWGLIDIADEATQELVIRAARGVAEDKRDIRVKSGDKGITSWVAEHKERALVSDVTGDPRYVPVMSEDVQSELAVPLLAGDRLIGVLDVESPRAHAFDEDDAKLVEALATQAAIAILRAEQYQKLQDTLLALELWCNYANRCTSPFNPRLIILQAAT